MFAAIVDAYRRTRKPNDILWNRFVARPAAAVLLVPLARTPVTPNQVTLATLAIFVGAACLMIFEPTHRGLIAAALVLELSYVFDCVDGQLARLRGISTPVGAHLDFLMDELKAFLLVTAAAIRLWRNSGDTRLLLEGLAALVAVASAISLTTFVRRPEYTQATGTKAAGTGDYGDGFAAPVLPPPSRSPFTLGIRGIEALGKFVIHYPSYILFVAIANRLDLFLHAYLAVNAAHALRTLASITLRLGRPAR